MSYYLYVIKSGNSRYIGVTKDLRKRLSRHNAGENRSTRHLKDWKIVHFERFVTLSEARRREIQIKKTKAKNLHQRGVAQPG